MIRHQKLPYCLSTSSTGWFGEGPPKAYLTHHAGTDAKLADAFRMLVYLETPSAQLWWLEHQLRSRSDDSNWTNKHKATLIRWWLEIFDASKRGSGVEASSLPEQSRQEASPPFQGLPAGIEFEARGSI